MNSQTFIKFCKEIDFDIPQHWSGSTLNEVVEDKDLVKKEILFNLSLFSLPTKIELIDFCDKTKKYFQPYSVNFKINFINKNYSADRIYQILDFYFFYFSNLDLKDSLNLDDLDFNVNQNVLNINLFSHIRFNKVKQIRDKINECLIILELNDLIININNKTESIIEIDENNLLQQQQQEYKIIKSLKEKNSESKTKLSESFKTNSFKRKYFKVSHQEFYETHETFLMVEGKVFQYEIIYTKTDLSIHVIGITDHHEAIIGKLFLRSDQNWDLSWLKTDVYVSIYGEKKSGMNNDVFLQIRKMEKLDNDDNQIIDNATKKRIEFSARTSMSAMDGFISPVKMMKFAKQLGHEAIAFVDYQNIQAFPDIYNNAKQIGIKPIYGSTFSVIEPHNGIIQNVKDALIKTENYIIFDLETTSLNPRMGEIIEFGAVEIEKGVVKKTHQFFIKAKHPISSFTTELTGISQKMIDEAKLNEAEAIEKIVEIFQDKTLVAHNATFDISFINEKLFQYGFEYLKNQIVDTLALAKYLLENSQNYRLETVSKKMGIFYDHSIAHRADYDAGILQKVWLNMIEQLNKININNFIQLNEVEAKHIHSKKFAYDIAVYAKNQAGLKELFKLVSLSLTENFFNGPRLFTTDLEKSPNLLIAPASINSYLMELIFTGTTEKIEAEIDKWDFIGIPAPHLFSHLVARGQYTESEIEDLIKDLVLRAKKKNKILVAIGDVRYLTKEQAIGHHVYINTKGLEGRRHPLFKYNEEGANYPLQKFLTTSEMKSCFNFLNSSSLVEEIVVENPNKLNSLIDENIEVIKTKLYAPNFDNSADKLKNLVYENAYKIYGQNLPTIIKERIDHELEPIIKYGFSVVYWISHKLVAKSNQDGYLVGSRGSVGSSLVATLSKITEVNPLIPHYVCLNCQYSEFIENANTTSGFDLPDKNCPNCQASLKKDGQTIPFETFLGFNADKVPDIDLNFSGDYQPIIHQEVKRMFGETHTFRAGTIATVAAKTAFGFVKKWNEEKNLQKSQAFVSYLSAMIEGSKRTTGQHPGGIIIIPKEFDVEDFSPINYPANDINSSWKTTHLDFHAIHDNVLKLDLLGHDDPTIIRHLQNLTNVCLDQISFSDPKVLSLFNSPEAIGVTSDDINGEPTGALGIPEFGTPFVRRMLNVAKPKSFNDLINLSGLSHGTDVWNGNAETLIKQGKTLNDVISCRDDIMITLIKRGIKPSLAFHIMEKVRKGKGLTTDEEDVLEKNGIENWYIDSLNKIKYMFPKAHATAYVMMAWRIAWFKIYYPLEYYAAYLTTRITSFDINVALGSKHQVARKLKELEIKQRNKHNEKISAKEEELIPTLEIINELLARNLKIHNIDLYKSESNDWVIDYQEKALIPPFIVVDGLGETVAKKIVEARKERKFYSVDDVQRRCEINKTLLEKLKQLGVFLDLDETDEIKLF